MSKVTVLVAFLFTFTLIALTNPPAVVLAANPCAGGDTFCATNDAPSTGAIAGATTVTVTSFSTLSGTGSPTQAQFVWKDSTETIVRDVTDTSSSPSSNPNYALEWSDIFMIPASAALGDWGVLVCFQDGGSIQKCDGTTNPVTTFGVRATSFFVIPEYPIGALLAVVLPMVALGGLAGLRRFR